MSTKTIVGKDSKIALDRDSVPSDCDVGVRHRHDFAGPFRIERRETTSLAKEQPMSVMLKKEYFIVALLCGAGGFGSRVEAQSAPALDQPDMRVVSGSVDSSAAKNEKLRGRVVTAMHVDPYLLDEHIEVVVANNAIVLRGFVLNAWELREAVRVARKVAGDTRVLDELSIKEGGS